MDLWEGMAGPHSAMTLHSTGHTSVSDGKFSSPLYPTQLVRTLLIHTYPDFPITSGVDGMTALRYFVSVAMPSLLILQCITFAQQFLVLTSDCSSIPTALCFLC